MKTITYDENTHKLVPVALDPAKLQRYREVENYTNGVAEDDNGEFVRLEDVQSMLALAPPAAPVAAVPEGLTFDGYHDSDDHYGKTILDLVRSRLEIDPDDLQTGDTFYVNACWVQPQEWRVVQSGNPFEVERVTPPSDGVISPELSMSMFATVGDYTAEKARRAAAQAVGVDDDFIALGSALACAVGTEAVKKAAQELLDWHADLVTSARQEGYAAGRRNGARDEAIQLKTEHEEALSAARQEGREKALEEAAKEADHWQQINLSHKCGSYIAAAIRALASSKPSEQGEG